MSSKKTRVAVIGCGAIAQRRHLPEYANRKDVEIVAVVDIKAGRAKEVGQQFNAAEAFTDYKKALALKPDAVSVCTPNAYHAEQAVAALKAKAHVLCEKPMATTVPELRAMNRAAKANRRQLMVGHNQRFNASHVRGKEMYQSGRLGKCLTFRTMFAHGGPEGWSVDGLKCNFFKKNQAVLGSLADLGVHKLDLMRWLLEDDFVEATAMTDTIQKKKCGVEDTAFAVLRTASGTIGQMYAGWTYPGGCDNSTVLYCEKGILRMEDDPNYPLIAHLRGGEAHYIKVKGIQTNEKGGQYGSGVIDSFIDAIRNNRKVPVTGEDAAKSVAAVLACVESQKKRRFARVAKV